MNYLEITGNFEIEKVSLNSSNFLFKNIYLNIFCRVLELLEKNNLFFMLEWENNYNKEIRDWDNIHYYDEDYDNQKKIFSCICKWRIIDENDSFYRIFKRFLKVKGDCKIIYKNKKIEKIEIDSLEKLKNNFSPFYIFLNEKIDKIEYYLLIERNYL